MCCQIIGCAQIVKQDIQLWFDAINESNAVSITSNFLSEAEDLIVLNFEISIISKENEVVEIEEIEKGEFLAAQNLPIPLSSKTIEIGSKDKISMILKIFQGNQKIIQEKYTWNKKINTSVSTNIAEVQLQNRVEQKIVKVDVGDQVELRNDSVEKIGQNIKKPRSNLDALEIQGLIIDETRSKIGRDFYEIFFRKWIAPKGDNGDFIITIKELPSFGRSSRVALEVNSQQLGVRNLIPRLEFVEQQVNASIRQIRRYLTQRSNISKDLENEDTSGSGIF